MSDQTKPAETVDSSTGGTIVSAALPAPVTRDSFRETLFANAKVVSTGKQIELFGQTVELRRPSLGKIIELQDAAALDGNDAMVQGLITTVYIPGTNDTVFQPGDADAIKALPFTDDVAALFNEIAKLIGVSASSAEKNSGTTL